MESTQDMMKRRERTAPPARDFFLNGGSTGVLLLHGFAGSIADLRGLAQDLHERGYTVAGVRLAGHGVSVKDLHRSCAEDWIASARSGYSHLRERVRTVVVVGDSMGGLIGLRISREYPDIRGVVLLAPPFRLRHERLRNIGTALLPSQFTWNKPWVNPDRIQSHLAKGSLLALSVGSYHEFLRIVHAERLALPMNKTPILSIFSKGDRVIDWHGSEVLSTVFPSKQVLVKVLDETVHHPTLAPPETGITETIQGFLTKVS